MEIFDKHISKMLPWQKDELYRVCSIVKNEAPQAQEIISYGMPAWSYNRRPLLYVGTFKEHMSLFPTSGPVKAMQQRLKQYKTSKGTIQFTRNNTLPDSLIAELVRKRLREIAEDLA